MPSQMEPIFGRIRPPTSKTAPVLPHGVNRIGANPLSFFPYDYTMVKTGDEPEGWPNN